MTLTCCLSLAHFSFRLPFYRFSLPFLALIEQNFQSPEQAMKIKGTRKNIMIPSFSDSTIICDFQTEAHCRRESRRDRARA